MTIVYPSKNSGTMFTKKEIIKIILFIVGIQLVACGIIWLICQIAPFIIAVIAFIPWLFAALKAGADV